MWDFRVLSRIDFAIFPFVLALMASSWLVIGSMTSDSDMGFWTPFVKGQMRWSLLGWGTFCCFAALDYRRLREWSPFLYLLFLGLLLGLFFVSPIQNVHRWYKIPGLMSFQPSEQAKIVLILSLAWFFERRHATIASWSTALQGMGLCILFFFCIVKQPDLGTALLLVPISLCMGYFAGIHKAVLYTISVGILVLSIVSALIFTGMISQETLRPIALRFLKEYQYERFTPNTYHQIAAQNAIAIGGTTGLGWKKGEFAGKKWLPAAHTDSVFAAIGEEFGTIGLVFLLLLFYGLIYRSFRVVATARDLFGRFLAAGLSAYLAMHVWINVAMMSALLPISGVPLLFVTYGGSSLVTTMAALGLLQSIYSRRFMF